MNKKINLLVHGPITSKKGNLSFSCQENLKKLFKLEKLFNYIIISCWVTDETQNIEKYIKNTKNIFIIKNKLPNKKSICKLNNNPSKNIYLQSYSILKGCEFLTKLEEKNFKFTKHRYENFVIKIRTDQEFPDYTGLYNYTKKTKILTKTLCVRAFRPSVICHISDTILISRLRLMHNILNINITKYNCIIILIMIYSLHL